MRGLPVGVLIGLVDLAFRVYYWLIIIRVLLSWFRIPSGRYFLPVYRFIFEMTEPFLAFFRRLMPSVMVGGGGIDFSPIVAILVLQFLLRPIVVGVLQRLLTQF